MTVQAATTEWLWPLRQHFAGRPAPESVPGDVRERRVDLPDVEPVRLEPPHPSTHVLELRVMRIEQQVQESRIPLDTAAVLRRS